jgi:hypothetical protein
MPAALGLEGFGDLKISRREGIANKGIGYYNYRP